MRRYRKTLLLVGVGLALLAQVPAPAAHAHGGEAPDLAFWGPFGRGTVSCLRVISQATRRCFDQVLTLHIDCRELQRAGQTCDTGARDAQIAAAQAIATGTVDAVCTGGQLTELRFAGFGDAKTDILRACGGEVDAVLSLLYPAAVVGTPAADCAKTVPALARKLVRKTLSGSSHALERIAKRVLPPSGKLGLIDAVRTRAAAAGAMCAARLHSACPTFAAAYGRSPENWIARLIERSDCVAHGTYFQTAVSCPFAECGNGVQEPDEACDDGNRVDTDACRNDCTPQPAS